MNTDKEITIRIKDTNTKEIINVDIALFYKIFCRKIVSKYYYLYKKVFQSYCMDINDLKQSILLMICNIVNKNEETQYVGMDEIGGYLFNATKWRLNSIVSKAMTHYKNTISLDSTKIDVIAPNNTDKILSKSEKILTLFIEQNDYDILKTIKEVCTEKEADSSIQYYFKNKNTVDLAKEMEITPQRVSALINSALLKLNNYFEGMLNTDKE